MTNGGWTDAEWEDAKRWGLVEGLSGTQIATALNRKYNTRRTRMAVLGKFHRKGIPLENGGNRRANGPRVRGGRKPGPKPKQQQQPKPQLFSGGLQPTTGGSKEPDKSVAEILRASAACVPASDSVGLVKIVDGKVHVDDRLHERACRFIEADPLKYHECYCGKETLAPLVQYCEKHFRKMYPTANVETAIRHAKREATASKRFEVVE